MLLLLHLKGGRKVRVWWVIVFIFFLSHYVVAVDLHVDTARVEQDLGDLLSRTEEAAEQADAAEKKVKKASSKRGILYKIYLSKCELDGELLRKVYLPRLSPEQINLALRDIRIFIRSVLRGVVRGKDRKADRDFLINILHIHGHIINFIEDSWVNLDTKKIVVTTKKGQRATGNVIPLARYWSWIEKEKGEKLHCYKFYASCIDYLMILIRSYFRFPCKDQDLLGDVEDMWLYWLIERLACKLDGHLDFGGYYAENVELMRQIFQIWKDDFEKKTTSDKSYTKGYVCTG